jgi:hypothetical protein
LNQIGLSRKRTFEHGSANVVIKFQNAMVQGAALKNAHRFIDAANQSQPEIFFFRLPITRQI